MAEITTVPIKVEVDALEVAKKHAKEYYNIGYNKAIDDFCIALKNYFIIPHDIKVIEMYAKELKNE